MNILATQAHNVTYKAVLFEGSLSREIDYIMDVIIQRKPLAETPNCGYVHPIPYCVVTHGDKILSYQRTSEGGEGRLFGQYSIGIGGHVDLDDLPTDAIAAITEAAFMEFEEELCIKVSDGATDFQILGTLYNDESEVNALHLGYICRFELTDESYNLLTSAEHGVEDHLCNVEFLSVNTLLENFDRYESWSQTLINDMDSDGVLDWVKDEPTESDEE